MKLSVAEIPTIIGTEMDFAVRAPYIQKILDLESQVTELCRIDAGVELSRYRKAVRKLKEAHMRNGFIYPQLMELFALIGDEK